MGLAYVNQEDVHKRLNESVCRYAGEPCHVYVDRDAKVNTVEVYFLPGSNLDKKTILTTDPLFDHSSPDIGYMNIDKACPYLARVPCRKQIQGLTFYNVVILKRDDKRKGIPKMWLTTKNFRHMMINQYPSYQLAFRSVEDGVMRGCAFNKHAAIQKIDGRNIGLLYRGRLVALHDTATQTFRLLPSLRDASYIYLALKTLGVPT